MSIVFLSAEITRRPGDALGRSLRPKLISIAMVSGDGVHEFYAESNEWPPFECTDFVKSTVLPRLTGPSMTPAAIADRLRKFLRSLDHSGPLQVATDFIGGWEFLLQLLGAHRVENAVLKHSDLSRLLSVSTFVSTRDAYFESGHPQHHALHDARAMRIGWLAWARSKAVMGR